MRLGKALRWILSIFFIGLTAAVAYLIAIVVDLPPDDEVFRIVRRELLIIIGVILSFLLPIAQHIFLERSIQEDYTKLARVRQQMLKSFINSFTQTYADSIFAHTELCVYTRKWHVLERVRGKVFVPVDYDGDPVRWPQFKSGEGSVGKMAELIESHDFLSFSVDANNELDFKMKPAQRTAMQGVMSGLVYPLFDEACDLCGILALHSYRRLDETGLGNPDFMSAASYVAMQMGRIVE